MGVLTTGVGLLLWMYRPRPAGAPRLGPSVSNSATVAPTPAPAPVEHEITLFFPDARSERLVPEKRRVPALDDQDLAQKVLAALVAGPQNPDLQPALPSDTQWYRVVLDDRHYWIIVDFTESVRKAHPGGSTAEVMSVYAVVNSLLANLKAYQRVWLLIEHQAQTVFKFHVFIGAPLPLNTALQEGNGLAE
ncbi:MAG: GerMN domain-containing protein [Acidobacteria bacterium]|nr:GerMN domain-containing protein [Acidobacteriota bacterium]MDW7983351.1 GerMN domain-containing protein [Acidobacteriota bacterium]